MSKILANPQINGDGRIAYSIDEVAKATGLGRTTLYAIIKKGGLPVVKLGRRTLIKSVDLENLLTPHQIATDNDPISAPKAEEPSEIPSAADREVLLRTIEKEMEPIPLSILNHPDGRHFRKAISERRRGAEEILRQREQRRAV